MIHLKKLHRFNVLKPLKNDHPFSSTSTSTVAKICLKYAIISPDDGAKHLFVFFVSNERLSRIWQGTMGALRAVWDISAGSALLEALSAASSSLDPATRTIEG